MSMFLSCFYDVLMIKCVVGVKATYDLTIVGLTLPGVQLFPTNIGIPTLYMHAHVYNNPYYTRVHVHVGVTIL